MQKIAIVVTLAVLFGTHATAQEVEEGLQRTRYRVRGSRWNKRRQCPPVPRWGRRGCCLAQWSRRRADVGYISSTTDFGEGLFLLTAGPIYEFQTGRRYNRLSEVASRSSWVREEHFR